MKNKSVIIIGGGLGGLFTGAILSKEGLQVTVLEKNATVGGGLQSFRRFGEIFDTGMHVFGGMQSGGNIRRICDYLGITDKVRIRDVDSDCTDKLYFAEDKTYYTIAKGRDNFVKSLARQFLDEEDDLKRYVEAIYKMTDEINLFHLRPSSCGIVMHSDDFVMSANDFIAKYIKNEKLRSVVAYMNPLYGGKGNQTPAYIHAIVNVLYINGASRFVDGSYRFANLLVDVIKQHGGDVFVNEGVEFIDTADRNVTYVRTSKSRELTADYYISDIHPCSLLKLLKEKSLPRAYCSRLDSIPNSYSAFSLYIKLKKDKFKYINHSEYYMTRYVDIWKFADATKPWPLGFLMMTPPDDNQGEYATKVLVTAPMTFDKVAPWVNTVTGDRGDDYLKWKNDCACRLLDMMEEIHPGFRDCIEDMNTSSPLTIRDYYHVKDGALSGFSKNCNNMVLSQVPVVTKIRNLLLTGQNNNLHGFCGVPLTAINTCEAILGLDYIVNKINTASKS